jgi:beta-glucosidase
MLGMTANGSIRVLVNDAEVVSQWAESLPATKIGRVHLEKGTAAHLVVEYGQLDRPSPIAQLVWTKYDPAPQPAALAAAKNADVIVAVVGITSELEGEEMPVSEPGFKGGDRTSLDLPKPEEDLLKALTATGKPLVVVLANGSALSVNWASQHANAILEGWYPGEEGGAAIAETLSGRNNPAGRLPVTFYTSADQLPPFENYFMQGRTYRYFTGAPLYPFGYGLSYTSFAYSNLSAPKEPVHAGDPAVFEVTVTNTGKLAGDEVAQLYLTFPGVKGAPLRALRGFERVHLEPGASQRVRFQLKPRDLSMVSEAGEPMVAEGNYSVTIGGGQPGTAAPAVNATFSIDGREILPE